MRGIMLARTKEIQVIELNSSSIIQINKCSVKENNRQQIMIPADNVESLIDMLKSESLI
jgi:hypothetical protein